MQRILIITGPGGDAQGWGDLNVTRQVREALHTGNRSAEIAFVEGTEAFLATIDRRNFDLVWSSLYFLSERADINGLGRDDAVWVADVLDERGIPYIGPDALAMKRLLQKHETHRAMEAHGVAVPRHWLVDPDQGIPGMPYPAFVKPNAESRSMGISDESVVHSPAELEARARQVKGEFGQAALVEEYLPGPEYTVAMLGNGRHQEFLPGLVTVDPSLYGKYPILRTDLRGVGMTRLSIPPTRAEEAVELTRQATDALKCWDHVRVDLRVAADGRMRVMEINGIPGLKPVKSWSPQLYSLYHPASGGAIYEYREMLNLIVTSALERWGI